MKLEFVVDLNYIILFTETKAVCQHWRSVQRSSMGKRQTGEARVPFERKNGQEETPKLIQKYDGWKAEEG